MNARLFGLPPAGLVALGAAGAALAVAPLFVNSYVLSVLILVLMLAYLGQAWNIMMGFAGLLSLGHALYFGLGAYTSAALFVHFGIGPWLGMIAGAALAVVAAAILGALAFRFRIGGVYFALLAIAFAAFTSILFSHLAWVGGSGGLYVTAAKLSPMARWTQRGAP